MSFSHPRPSGLIALSIDEGDSLIKVGITDGSREILMATREGLAIRFPEEQVRPMGRTARGVRAITLKREGDAVVGMVIADPNMPELLTVCDNGYGKRTPIEDYRLQGRGGSGIINIKTSERNGLVAGVCCVNADDELMVVTNRGMMIRTLAAQISLSGRATQGVRVISVTEGESIASVARIAEREDTDQTAGVAGQDSDASMEGAEDDGQSGEGSDNQADDSTPDSET